MTDYIQRELLGVDDQILSAYRSQHNVTLEEVQQKVQRIKEWKKNQPHLQNVEMVDNFLFRALSFNKFDDEKVRSKIEAMATARTEMPEIFHDRHPMNPRVAEALKSLQMITMPTAIENKTRVSIFTFNVAKHDVFDLELFALGVFIVADLKAHTETIKNHIAICDCSNLSASQITQLNINTIKKLLNTLQSCYSYTDEHIHIINAHPVAEILAKIVKSILKKKIADRFTVHSTKESFHKAFPVKYLPKDMGGDVPLTMKEIATKWENAIKTQEITELILRIDKMKSDESKRRKNKDFLIHDRLGVTGMFRKLDLD